MNASEERALKRVERLKTHVVQQQQQQQQRGNCIERRETSASFFSSWASKHPDDVVIVCALRTPITRARKGGLKDTTADDLVATVLRACLRETNVDANDIGDVVVGSVLGDSSQRANECRIGMFLAGFPVKVPVRTVNRQCSSGLQACADVASAIKAGYYDVGIAAGVETMSKNPMKWDGGFNPKAASVTNAQNCLIPMGVTSENVAAKWHISRETQDAFAAESHRRAAKARKSGKFKSQIVPVVTKIIDKDTKEEKEIVVTEDDGIREGVTMENLAKLKPVFKKRREHDGWERESSQRWCWGSSYVQTIVREEEWFENYGQMEIVYRGWMPAGNYGNWSSRGHSGRMRESRRESFRCKFVRIERGVCESSVLLRELFEVEQRYRKRKRRSYCTWASVRSNRCEVHGDFVA